MAHIYTEAPQNATETQYQNLENIKKQASAAVMVAQETRGKIQVEDQKDSLRAEEAKKESFSSEAHGEVATSLIAEGLGLKGADDMISLLSERRDAARLPTATEQNALGGFIGGAVQTMDDMLSGASKKSSFSLGERATLAGNALTGKSEAAGDDYIPSAKGWRGTETQMTFTAQLANQRNYEMAKHLQQDYEARISNQVYVRGYAPGSMSGAQRHDLALNSLGPKPPKFKDVEEDATNWGAGSVTG
jgi:hypothetical protein